MTFIFAYSICVTLLAFVLAAAVFRDPSDAPSPFSKTAGVVVFALALVGLCALAANGLVAIAEAVR